MRCVSENLRFIFLLYNQSANGWKRKKLTFFVGGRHGLVDFYLQSKLTSNALTSKTSLSTKNQ
jgi:hypothetical protein